MTFAGMVMIVLVVLGFSIGQSNPLFIFTLISFLNSVRHQAFLDALSSIKGENWIQFLKIGVTGVFFFDAVISKSIKKARNKNTGLRKRI